MELPLGFVKDVRLSVSNISYARPGDILQDWMLHALRGSLPGAERVSAASDGTAAGLCVKRSFGCMEGLISASLQQCSRLGLP